MPGTNLKTAITATLNIREADESGLALSATCTGAPPTTAGTFQHGCLIVRTDSGTGNKAVYENTGSTASPAWDLIGDIATTDIAAGAVTLAKLASGITPSHVVKFAGKATWAGSGATKALTVTGVAATDVVVATVQTKPTETAYLVGVVPTTDTLTFELSAANTTNDAVIAYSVLRVAA